MSKQYSKICSKTEALYKGSILYSSNLYYSSNASTLTVKDIACEEVYDKINDISIYKLLSNNTLISENSKYISEDNKFLNIKNINLYFDIDNNAVTKNTSICAPFYADTYTHGITNNYISRYLYEKLPDSSITLYADALKANADSLLVVIYNTRYETILYNMELTNTKLYYTGNITSTYDSIEKLENISSDSNRSKFIVHIPNYNDFDKIDLEDYDGVNREIAIGYIPNNITINSIDDLNFGELYYNNANYQNVSIYFDFNDNLSKLIKNNDINKYCLINSSYENNECIALDDINSKYYQVDNIELDSNLDLYEYKDIRNNSSIGIIGNNIINLNGAVYNKSLNQIYYKDSINNYFVKPVHLSNLPYIGTFSNSSLIETRTTYTIAISQSNILTIYNSSISSFSEDVLNELTNENYFDIKYLEDFKPNTSSNQIKLGILNCSIFACTSSGNYKAKPNPDESGANGLRNYVGDTSVTYCVKINNGKIYQFIENNTSVNNKYVLPVSYHINPSTGTADVSALWGSHPYALYLVPSETKIFNNDVSLSDGSYIKLKIKINGKVLPKNISTNTNQANPNSGFDINNTSSL